MTLKIAYTYEQNDANEGTNSANQRESEWSGVSQVELTRLLGGFFLNDLYKVENQALTLNIAISEESPERIRFIADLLFKGITNKQSCVTKVNVEPQTLFTSAQFEQINQKLNANKAALLVAPKSVSDNTKKKDDVNAAQASVKPNTSSDRVWLKGLLAAGLSFVAILSFSSLLPALLISASIGFVVSHVLSKPSQENATLEPKNLNAMVSQLHNQDEQAALAQCNLAQLVGYELSRNSKPSTEFSEHCRSEALVGLVRCK